jgi:beta-hydroxylase
VIARSSKVGNAPVLDSSHFPWIAELERRWPEIKTELDSLLAHQDGIPPLAEISPDHRRIAPPGKWKSFFLHGYGYRHEANIRRCPRTAEAVAGVPGLNSAFFSILAPGASIPDHRGPTKGIITCHLTLQTPSFDDCRLLIGGREVGWTEGEFLILDDSYRHEVSNKSDVIKVVLLIQVRRPSRWPGRLLIAMFLWGIRRSRFVQEARRNLTSWDAATARVEAAA